MSFDTEPDIEKSNKGGKKPASSMTLQKAVDMGEYEPDFLATFAEWHTLSPHVQLQFIRQGLENRRKHLLTQWAEINNVLHFSLKPEMKDALDNIHKQLRKLDDNRERIYLEYSNKV